MAAISSIIHRKIVPPRPQSFMVGILGTLYVIVFFFLLEGNGLLANGDFIGKIDNFQFFALSGLAFLLGVSILSIAYFGYRTTTQWGWLLIALLLAAGNTVAVVMNCNDVIYDGNVVFTFDIAYKARFIILGFLNALTFFLAYSVLPRIIGGTMWIRYVLRIIVFIAILSIAGSLVMENEAWKLFFTEGKMNQDIGSFYANKNIFGFVLFVAFLSEFLVLARTPRWWRWLIVVFLALMQIPLMSRTHSIIVLFMMIVMPIMCFARSFKAHKIRNLLILMGVLLVLAGIVIYFVIPDEKGNAPLLNAFQAADVSKFRVIDDNADGFGGIHGRAAANGNDVICAAVLIGCHAALYILNGGVCLNIGINFIGQSSLVQHISDLLGDAEFQQIRIGADKGFGKAPSLNFIGNGRNSPFAVIRCFI